MGRDWNAWAVKPFQIYGPEQVRMSRENTARIIEAVLCDSMENIRELAKDPKNPGLVYIAAKAMLGAAQRKEFGTVEKLLDRVIGKASQPITLVPPAADKHGDQVDFETFCVNAGYPHPFSKQLEMKVFGIDETTARMLLGARGYGKTDYVVILGTAYELYRDYMESVEAKRLPEMSFLLVTKSDERNAAILNEIAKAAASNGVPFEKQSAKALRVTGLQGKDHSVSAITIGSASIRGRHPKKIIMDDPVTEEDVSESTRRRAQRVYNELNKLSGDILIIGQPVHKFDLYETLRPLKGIKRLEVPHGAIPELDHDLEAQRLAGVSEESISASYHLKVIAEAGNPLEHVHFLPDFPIGESSVAFIDPSFEGGDYTAMTIVRAHFQGVAVKGRVWKRAWFNCLDEIGAELEACNVQRVCFETNALGDQPVVMLRDVVPESIGVVGKKTTGHKHSRIMAAGAFAPLIHIAETSDRLYIEQIIKYEYGAKNDDAPDSLASALEWIGLIRGRTK